MLNIIHLCSRYASQLCNFGQLMKRDEFGSWSGALCWDSDDETSIY
jgi:hypothetical protein